MSLKPPSKNFAQKSTSKSKKTFVFSLENQKKIKSYIASYPKARSALIPILDLAQRQNNGWLSREAMEEVANILTLEPLEVWSMASFYTLFNLQPVGKYLIQICRTTSCWLCGSDRIRKACEQWLGISVGETTADGMFTLKEVECLGACANAPMVQINDTYYEDLSPDSIVSILDSLVEGTAPKEGSQIGRHGSEPWKEV